MAKGLSRETIVDAAFEALDENGIDGLTVRAVATRLGVKAPALYWHVRDKKELLDEMGTRVWRGIAAAAAAADPRSPDEAFAGYAHAARRGLLTHRDGARAFSGTYLTDPGVLREQEEGLHWMAKRGFSPEATTDAYAVLTSFVVGHCIEEQERAQASDDRYSTETRDARVEAGTHPLVAASGHRLAADPDLRFTMLLAIVIDGIRALRVEEEPV